MNDCCDDTKEVCNIKRGILVTRQSEIYSKKIYYQGKIDNLSNEFLTNSKEIAIRFRHVGILMSEKYNAVAEVKQSGPTWGKYDNGGEDR